MSVRYIAVLLTISIIGMTFLPANAAQLDVAIPKDSEKIIPTFQITRIVTIQYDNTSNLAKIIGDKQYSISHDINSENAPVLIDLINSSLEEKSFSKVTEIDGKYSAIISPQENSVTIEYKIVIYPTIEDHFLLDSGNFLDLGWRGFEISEEIPISTEEGDFDINSPKSALKYTIPEALDYLSQSDADEVLELKMVNFKGISDLPLSSWESLFDPTAVMSETQSYGFSGNVLTNYSMGICTIYGGICQDKEIVKEFVIDNERYQIRSIESQDDATIVVEGYVEELTLGNTEGFRMLESAPTTGNENDTQVPALYAISGVGVVVALGFFLWSSKKSKSDQTEQTGVDPRDLQPISINSDAGSYQTNRVTAVLKDNT